MGEEGSKAMTIYIVACFVLAMVALVGYKFMNEAREANAAEYVGLAGSFADMSAAFAPNISDYYKKVVAGQIKPRDKRAQERTDVTLREIADKLTILDGVGPEDHRDIGSIVTKRGKQFVEHSLTVELKNVTQTEWAVFLSQAQHATQEYAFVQTIKCSRAERRYARLDIAKDQKDDRALWTVVITFVWFSNLNE